MRTLIALIFLFSGTVVAGAPLITSMPEYIPVEDALKVSVMRDKDSVFLKWRIHACCKLYYNKIVMVIDGANIPHSDYLLTRPYYVDNSQPDGYQNVFTGTFGLNIKSRNEDIILSYQGCNNSGFCYPPQRLLIEAL